MSCSSDCNENQSVFENETLVSEIEDQIMSDGKYVFSDKTCTISVDVINNIPYSHCFIFNSGEVVDCCEAESIEKSDGMYLFKSCYDENKYKISLELIDTSLKLTIVDKSYPLQDEGSKYLLVR